MSVQVGRSASACAISPAATVDAQEVAREAQKHPGLDRSRGVSMNVSPMRGHAVRCLPRGLHWGALYGLIVFVTLGCPAGPSSIQGGNEGRIRELRYPAGFDVRTHERSEHGTFTVSFLTRLSYPSDAVLRFYDRELERLGWVPFAEPGYEQGYRRWDCFEDLTRPSHPFVHQLGAKWANREKTRMVLLVIRYLSNKVEWKGMPCAAPDNDTQEVDVQLMPFVLLPPPGTPVPSR